MTTRRITYLLAIALVAGTAGGCGSSASARFYTLRSTATAHEVPVGRYAVLVGPVSVPAAVDRSQFVVQVAPNRVEIDEFNRWAGPLNDAIAHTVANDLSVLLHTPDVAAAQVAHFDPNYRVTLDVQRFESTPGEAVLIDVVWAVRVVNGNDARSGRTTAREAVQSADFDAIAAAHSRALGTVSRDIAAAIQAAERAAGSK